MTDQDDQIARAQKELKERNILKNARQRSQRRKSIWDQLLLTLVFPIWLLFTYVIVELLFFLHVVVHPEDGGLLQSKFLLVTVNAPVALMLMPPMIATIPAAMIVSNFLVYRIPAARRAMEQEDRGIPGVDYDSSQRALRKLTGILAALAVVLALIGVALGATH